MTKAETREKFANSEYPIQVVGRHVEITEAMKSYAVDKLTKIERFGGRILDATIRMDIQRLIHCVDFIVDVNNTKIKVSGKSDNMYTSIDLAAAHLGTKFRRYMSRLNEHHAKGVPAVDMNVKVVGGPAPLDEINDQIEEENLKKIEADFRPHEIVSRETIPLKTLDTAEAIMKMELSEDRFLIFKSQEDLKLKIIYRRNDGNYGIIEPEK